MTKEELIDMARQSGWEYAHDESGFEPLWTFAKLVAEKAIKESLAQSDKYPQIAISPEIVGYVAPQRTWVGLTDEERQDIALEVPIDAVLITEAKLKDKNAKGQE